MFNIVKLMLFFISGIFVGFGLVLQVKGVMGKALGKKTNQIALGVLLKLSGMGILAFLIVHYKAYDFYSLISFFVPALVIILWNLFNRDKSSL